MKPKIHPKYYNDCKVACACGNSFTTGSTSPEIKTEICSACHPFFTGEMRFVDAQGRVEAFQKKMEKARVHIKKKAKQKKKEEKEKKEQPKTLKEMLKVDKKKVKTKKSVSSQKTPSGKSQVKKPQH